MGWAHILLVLVALQRLGELALARRNTARLLARGGREIGAAHYPLFILLQGGWLATLAVLSAPSPPVIWPLLGFFALLQIIRVWVIATLGPYWTTRIITLDDVPLRRTGPYRFLRHPNYAIVGAEIPTLALALGLPRPAIAFGLANIGLLAYRMRIENIAIADRRGL